MIVLHTQERKTSQNGFVMFKCNTIFITVLHLFSCWFRVNVFGCIYIFICVFPTTSWNEGVVRQWTSSLCLIKSCVVPKAPSCPEGLILATHLRWWAALDEFFSPLRWRWTVPAFRFNERAERCCYSHEESVGNKGVRRSICSYTKTQRYKMCSLNIGPKVVLVFLQ